MTFIWKDIFDMDNNKEWYVFMKEADMGINDGVDIKIISHLRRTIKISYRRSVGSECI